MKYLKGWKELAFIFILALLSAFFVRNYLLAPYRVPTSSMQPALKPGDFIFVSQMAYGFPGITGERRNERAPLRGDLVTFSYPREPRTTFVKRVIGLPGDRIEIRKGRLIINGRHLDYKRIDHSAENPDEDLFEVYTEKIDDLAWKVIFEKGNSEKSLGPLVVPPGEVFLLGDNRDTSEDSRYWGTVPIEHIYGRVSLIWLSLNWQQRWGGDRVPSLRWERLFSRVH